MADELAPDNVDLIEQQWRRARPDLDPSPQGVIGRLHRVGLAVTARLTPVFAEYGLTEAEFDLLAALRRSDPDNGIAAGELASHTMVTTGGLTKRVDRLEQRGLVARRGSASDGRRRVIYLTANGRDLIDRAFTAHLTNEHRILAELGEADTEQLRAVLTRWLARLETCAER